MNNYAPRVDTDTHRLISYLVKHAPHGGEKWVLTKTLAEGAELASQTAVHGLLQGALLRGVAIREHHDERIRWQAGPDAAAALERSGHVQPLTPMGFPNEKPRERVEFKPREGGSMDRAIKLLESMGDDATVEEGALRKALEMEGTADLRQQMKAAVDAGALTWDVRPDGAELRRYWALGDGFPPHVHEESGAPPRRGGKRTARDSAPPDAVAALRETAAVLERAATPAPAAVVPAPAERPAAVPEPTRPPSGSMAFRVGLFSDGLCTIQKGHGAVELDEDEVLTLFEHIAPFARSRGKR
jgi:hypothetical protein